MVDNENLQIVLFSMKLYCESLDCITGSRLITLRKAWTPKMCLCLALCSKNSNYLQTAAQKLLSRSARSERKEVVLQLSVVNQNFLNFRFSQDYHVLKFGFRSLNECKHDRQARGRSKILCLSSV